MERRVLCLDCDGVIFDTVNMLKEMIANINFLCSDEFKSQYIDRAYQNNEMDLVNMYTRIQIITRDEVLEETKDLYKGRILYSKIYVIKNTFAGVIDAIRAIYNTGYYDKIYITTHVNTIQESLAKQEFFSEYLPFVEVFTIQFKDTPYDHDKGNYFANANRQRTNKPLEFFKSKHEDPKATTFVDDADSICRQAIELGADAYFCGKEESPLSVFYAILEKIEREMGKGRQKTI
jgi:hypothetical protein